MSPGKMVDLGGAKAASSGKPPVKGGVKILNKVEVKAASNGVSVGSGIKLLNKGKPQINAQHVTKQNSEAAEKAAAELKKLSIGALPSKDGDLCGEDSSGIF